MLTFGLEEAKRIQKRKINSDDGPHDEPQPQPKKLKGDKGDEINDDEEGVVKNTMKKAQQRMAKKPQKRKPKKRKAKKSGTS